MSTRISDLARHTGVYGLGTIVGGIARAALVPIIARYVTTDEYGKASVVLIFMTLYSIVAESGLSASLIKFASEAGTEDERRQVVSTVVASSLVLALPLTAIAGFTVAGLARVLLGSSQYSVLIWVGIAGGLGNAILQIGLSVERALARSSRYVLYTLAKGMASLVLSVVLVVSMGKQATGLLVGTALPPLAIGLLVYLRLFRGYGLGLARAVMRSVVRFGSPLVPMNVSMWVLASSDIYLIRRLLPPAVALGEVGLYQYAHEVCLVLVLPITSFNLAWPQFLFSTHSRPDARETFARVYRYFAFFLIEAAFLLSVFAHDVVRLVGSADYLGSYHVIPYLAGSLVFYGFSNVFASGLYVAGKTTVLASIAAGAAAMNILLNVLLIPELGIRGAALATLATNLVMASAALAFSQACYRIPFKLRSSMIGCGAAACVVAGLSVAARDYGPISNLLPSFAVASCFTLLLILLLGLRPADLRQAISVVAGMAKPARSGPSRGGFDGPKKLC